MKFQDQISFEAKGFLPLTLEACFTRNKLA